MKIRASGTLCKILLVYVRTKMSPHGPLRHDEQLFPHTKAALTACLEAGIAWQVVRCGGTGKEIPLLL